jgi:amino acid adenylation domain-containing protein
MFDIVPLHTPILNQSADPDRPILSWKHGSISYGEFRANIVRIAAWLRSEGCVHGDRVAILLPKSVEFVEAIFATMAAGAAYVPLDINSPPARIKSVLDSAEPRIVITCEPFASKLSAKPDWKVHVIGTSDDGRGLCNYVPQRNLSENELPEPSIDDLAAILYTSGSTGQPKGVMLTHKNIGAFVAWAFSTFSMNQHDRLISIAPFHFDLSTLDLFATARAGASVHLLDEATLKFPAAISLAMERQQITICYAAPTIWRMLESHGRLSQVDLTALRLAIFAGEVFPMAALRQLMSTLRHPAFYNLYGPTETNVCSYYRVPELPAADATSIPIGAACENLELTIRDESGALVGTGEIGEICVAGDAVTIGYQGEPEQTLAVRVNGNGNSYRTGDLGHWDEDGMLRYRGRKDNQVKIRGNRIELSEIEAVLGSHPGVAEAMVKLESGGEYDYKLSAFVVRSASGSEEDELLQHCRQRLPLIAIPQEIRFMDSFPHTSTGKIDRPKMLENS